MHTGTMDDTLGALMAERAWLAGLARALVDDDATAEDLVQDTWLVALRNRGPIGAPRAWLATVLRNRARERARRATRRALREAGHGHRRSEDVPSSSEVVEHFETQRTVAQAVADLDEPFRTTVLLRYYEGLAPTEIARREGVPAGTVRWRLHRAHELLRGRLDAEYGGDRWKATLLPLCAPFAPRAGAGGLLAAAAVVLVIGSAIWLAVVAFGGGEPVSPRTGTPATRVAGPEGSGATANDRTEVPGVADDPSEGAAPASPPEGRALRDDEFAIVRARFVDPYGAPVPGVRLTLSRVAFGSFWVEAKGLSWIVPPTRASADGRAAFPLRAPAAVVESIPEPFRPRPGTVWRVELTARADGFAPWVGPVHVGHGDDLDLGDRVLRPAARLTGYVRDADGDGVGDAEVVIETPPFTDRASSYVDDGRTPSSDLRGGTASFWSRGSYSIDAVPHGPVVVWARKDGFRSAWRLVDVGGAEVVVEDLVLEPMLVPPEDPQPELEELAVRVVAAESGAPVGEAQVSYRMPNRGGASAVMPDGSTTIGWPKRPEGPPAIDVIAVDRSGEHGAVRRPDVDPAQGELTIELPRARTFELSVTGAGGRPVTGFLAGWKQGESAGEASYYRRDDDGDGRVELVVPPCDAGVFVDAPGHREYLSEPFPEGGLPSRLEVVLTPLAGLKGSVVADGEPIADAGVLVLRPAEPFSSHGFRARFESHGIWNAKTGADGAFRLDLEEGGPLRLLVRAEGLAPALTGLVDYDPARGIDDLVIEMTHGGTLEGVVRRADGRPIPRAVVALNDFLGHPITARAGLDGRFRFAHVRPATYELHRIAEMIREGDTSTGPLSAIDDAPIRADLVVRDGETVVRDIVVDRCALTVHLPKTPDLRGWSAKLRQRHDGRVLDEDDAADRDGAFRLATAWTGDYLLRIRSAGGPLGSVTVEATVTLEEGANDLVVDVPLVGFEGAWPTTALDGVCELVQQRGPTVVRVAVQPDPATGRFAVPLAPVGPVELVQRQRAGRRVLGATDVR